MEGTLELHPHLECPRTDAAALGGQRVLVLDHERLVRIRDELALLAVGVGVLLVFRQLREVRDLLLRELQPGLLRRFLLRFRFLFRFQCLFPFLLVGVAF